MEKSTIISVALATSLILGNASAFAKSTEKTWKETKVYTVIGGESDRDHTAAAFEETIIEVEVWSKGENDSSKIPCPPKVKHIVLTGGETAPENGE